jgi:CrcB protein
VDYLQDNLEEIMNWGNMGVWGTMGAIFIGGGAGSVARWAMGLGVSKLTTFTPAGVLAANVLATGILAGLIVWGGLKYSRESESLWMPLLVIGFCGGFSTFSTFSLDTFKLFQEGNFTWALLNIIVSLVACIGVAWSMYAVVDKS